MSIGVRQNVDNVISLDYYLCIIIIIINFLPVRTKTFQRPLIQSLVVSVGLIPAGTVERELLGSSEMCLRST